MSKAEFAKTENQITVANVGITIVVIKKLFYCSSFGYSSYEYSGKGTHANQKPSKIPSIFCKTFGGFVISYRQTHFKKMNHIIIKANAV
jgi:hypothetical protein